MMTDQEFEQKVSQLRDAFKQEMLSTIGGHQAFLTKEDQEFLDAFSISAYASLSIMATLSSVLMTRYVLTSNMTAEEAIESADTLFHGFLHELLEKGKESFLQNLQQYKNLKTSN